MASLSALITACAPDEPGQQALLQRANHDATLWEKWLTPITDDNPVGDDPGYDDDFQQMREELNKLSGIDGRLICALAEKLLITRCKDIRVACWYLWARLQLDGESGLAEGLSLLVALINRFGNALLPVRASSRKMAIEWLNGSRVLDTLTLHPEVEPDDFARIVAALALLDSGLQQWDEKERPTLDGLYAALENRLVQSGGLHAVVPQTPRAAEPQTSSSATSLHKEVQSGRDLLDQTRVLARYLHQQPLGWLAAHRLMKSIRWDTIHEIPPLDASGRTRLAAPRADSRAQLKRLYLQQSWQALLEHAGSLFGEGVNHLWLDLQWYLHQALSRTGAPYDGWAEVIREDLRLFLQRLPGFETLAWNDGSAVADEVTLNWIIQQVKTPADGWISETPRVQARDVDNDILQLEPEALAQADSAGIDTALSWLQSRAGSTTRERWLLRLVMARVAGQCGKNDMALYLLHELVQQADNIMLSDWEPELIFEAKARSLKLLRMKASRSESDKARLSREMDALLSGLITLDPARAAVLCG